MNASQDTTLQRVAPEDALPAVSVEAALAGVRGTPFAARILLALLGRISIGRLTVTLPDARRFELGSGEPAARLDICDWGAFGRALRAGDIGFAEGYMDGQWTTPDLAALLTVFTANRDGIERAFYGGFWGGMVYRMKHLLNANTRRGSRRNIAAHYDLGNDFYALWLDRSMTYSSALFGGDYTQGLERAQQAKYRRILERLAPAPGDHVLEIGCGWGGFAEMAARDYGCRVTALTLSREQLGFAAERLRRAGVADRVTLELRDYRDVNEQFDHVASIEMYEAVGERYWPSYFRTVARTLRPGGRAVIQAIVIDDRFFDRYRVGTDFIQQYIFPGGMLASPSRFTAAAAAAGLATSEAFSFGFDYAETLRRWRFEFDSRLADIRSLGYDERFIRMWAFYLAYCEAAFTTRCTDVIHFELSHSRA